MDSCHLHGDLEDILLILWLFLCGVHHGAPEEIKSSMLIMVSHVQTKHLDEHKVVYLA